MPSMARIEGEAEVVDAPRCCATMMRSWMLIVPSRLRSTCGLAVALLPEVSGNEDHIENVYLSISIYISESDLSGYRNESIEGFNRDGFTCV